MTNPFSRFLGRDLGHTALDQFRHDWDLLEALIVQLYRGEVDPTASQGEWASIRRRARKGLRRFGPALKPYWQDAKVGGEDAAEDPFVTLTRSASTSAFVDNWRMMQTLPAARQALNGLLIAAGQKS
jgi:hypothetical protein